MSAPKTCAVLGMVVAVACSEAGREDPPPASAPEPAGAFAALYERGGRDGPRLFAPLEELSEADRRSLATRLEAAAAAGPGALDRRARVVVSNDAWGVWHRARAVPQSSPALAGLERAAAALVERLSVPPPRAPPDAAPPEISAALPARDGWREVGSEMPVLGHERHFGLRRHFHLRVREVGGEPERALYSTLVALDGRGRPYDSGVAGDLEVLRFVGDRLVGARLFELDRAAVLAGRPGLVEVGAARQVPGLGADRALARFDPPVPLSELPCARCHDDAGAMSLPDPSLPPRARRDALLRQVEAPPTGAPPRDRSGRP